MDGSFINGMWYGIYITALVLFFFSLIFGNYAQRRTVKTFNSFAETKTISGVEAQRFSMIMLNKAGLIDDVEVVEVNGKQTDCYNPDFKVLKLSKNTINSTSFSALGICAHEIGHAIQDKEKKRFYVARRKLTPIFNFLAKLFFPTLIVGSLISFTFGKPNIGLIFLWFSIISFALSIIFYLVILPLEKEASKKAVELLQDCDFFTEDEINVITFVLKAAIWTYASELMASMLFFVNFLSYERIIDGDD